ncbi:divergent polysaccharide deacetylase family protein [Sulfitobacter sp.]|uniref:divergent polysaccharide deacetylase family protein n=1 Tax=Sulfitobacter sp. TaxID=1903071 RepID=UPI003002D7A2
MARGILSGIGLGAVFSVGVACVVSVLVPIEPQRAPELGTAETVAVPEPTVSEPALAITSESGSAIVQPQISLRAPSGEDLPKEPVAAALAPEVTSELSNSVAEAPASPAPVTAPAVETATLAPKPSPLALVESDASDVVLELPAPLPLQPETGDVADLTQPRPLPESVIIKVEEDAPVLPNPQALAPMIPDDSADGEIAQQSAEPLAPAGETDETLTVVTPEPEAEAETENNEETVVAVAPKPRVVQTPGSQVGSLGTTTRPTVGTPASTLINRSDAAEVAPVETVTQATDDSGETSPLRRYAQPFENPEGKPLMAIVLMDNGVDLDATEIGLPALSSFPYPISFAVDVRLVDAADRMARYRAKGFDVLATLDLPQGAQPSDAEVSMSVTLNGLPEIVGVLEGTGEGLQNSRAVADQVTGILKASGHGLVTQNKGLNSMPKLAVKEGVHAAPVFRDFDGVGQKPRVIRRFLDQAAFKAGQEGGVIMLGRLRPETIEALLVWGLADRAGSVALAPVSAVLLNQR